MSYSRNAAPPNVALALIQAAKYWLLDALTIQFAPKTSMLSNLTRQLPLVGALLPAEKKSHPSSANFNHYLKHLRKHLQTHNSGRELFYFTRLHNLFYQEVELDDFKAQVFFILAFYGRLNAFAQDFALYTPHSLLFSEEASPRNQLVRAFQEHIRKNPKTCDASMLKTAQLAEVLKQAEQSYEPPTPKWNELDEEKSLHFESENAVCRQVSPSLQARRLPQERPNFQRNSPNPFTVTTSPSQLPRPSIYHRPPRTPRSSFGPSAQDRSLLPFFGSSDLKKAAVDEKVLKAEAATFETYQKAAKNYSFHLLASILTELKTLYQSDKNHPLFSALDIKENKTIHQVAHELLATYFYRLQKQAQIDAAFKTTAPPFNRAWEKYKLIERLRAVKTVSAFHEILAEEKNREILKPRRDTHLETFLKACGLAVLTIIGLPLGLVGGAYLGYHLFFGKRATHGKIFLNDIDKLSAQAKPKMS